MDFSEKTVKENLIFDGKILHLYKDDILLPNGHPAFREYIRHQGAVCVVPLTEQKDIILVEQYRYPMKNLTLEIPAGKLDPGETPLQGAVRELEEETGLRNADLRFIGELYTSPAILTEVIHMYIATGFTAGEQHPDDDEFVRLVTMPLDKAVQKILDGEIKDAKTQAAVLKTALLLKD